MEIEKIMVISLSLTIVIECFLAFLFGVRKKSDYGLIVLVNILTNPLVVSISFFTAIRFGTYTKRNVVFFLELFAVIAEGFIYKRMLDYKKLKSYLFSILLNGASYFWGIIINALIWP